MKPINIYIQSRITDTDVFNSVHRHVSEKTRKGIMKEHEILSLRLLSDSFVDNGVSIDALDGFFYGYQIPRIGKEFDLLKFKFKRVLNIELKSQIVSENQILEQLLRNRYYLSHLGTDNLFYTVVTSSMTCYKLAGDILEESDLEELSRRVLEFSNDYLTDIKNLFRESDYLVSPFDTPEKFINGEYFLSGAQEQIKNKIINQAILLEGKGFFSIKGMPGTGKTLLLYDTAKKLSEYAPTLVVHQDVSKAVKEKLCGGIPNFFLCDFKDAETELNNGCFTYILIDEAQSLEKECFEKVVKYVSKNNAICIFSSDPEEILTTKEKERGITEKIKSVSALGEYELSEKIRSNKDIYAFISVLKSISRRGDFDSDFSDVELSFASSTKEACSICSYYKGKGYKFINFGRNSSSTDFSSIEETFDPNRIIGVELEKAVMLMDNSFHYDASLRLEGVPVFDPDKLYPNPFYSSITRIRDKLAIVVLKDEKLFSQISSIISDE